MIEVLRVVIDEIERQYADMVTGPTAEIQAELAKMAARTTWQLNVCLVCAWIALVLAAGSIVLLLIRNMKQEGRHRK